MSKRFITLLICLLYSLTLSGCFSKEKVTNNIINNKVVNVSDYTIDDVQDAIVIATEKIEQCCVAIKEASLTSSSLGSAVIVKRVAYFNNQEVSDDSSNISHYEYYAITNAHVINSAKIRSTIYLSDKITDESQQVSDVEIIVKNESLDLAIIRFTSTIYKLYANLSNSLSLKKGQIVLACGTPMSIDYFNTVTYGVISHPYRYAGVNENYNYFIQHDAAINPGNSGGGLFDLEGNLIGINTWKLVDDENTVMGIGFAIPSNVIYTNYKKYITSYYE